MTERKGQSMKQYLVKPESKIKLSNYDPSDTGDFKGDKKDGLAQLEKLKDKLDGLQELVFAEHKHKVLIILQAMDTGGKDGAIRRVFDGVNPAGGRVARFKGPTPGGLKHNYLWRIRKQGTYKCENVLFQ